MARLREAEKLLGIEIVDTSIELALTGSDITSALVPGARVCFAGTAKDAAGRVLSRDEIEGIARCDVLVTAEVGSRSGKAGKAHEFGKPVFCADEFLVWVGGRQARLAR
jgi:hypothetical protein